MMYDAGMRLVVELTDCMLFASLCQETRGNLVHEQTSIENNAEVYAKDASVYSMSKFPCNFIDRNE